MSRPLTPDRLPSGLDRLWHAAAGFLGDLRPRAGGYLRLARRIAADAARLHDTAGEDLNCLLDSHRAAIRTGRDEPAQRHAALAAVAEAARRQLGLTPHPEQIAGSLVLLDRHVAEMATGEGKTLTAAIAAVLAGWRGRGCHVVTVNDYLAARDAATMRPLLHACGLSVAHVDAASTVEQRRAAYAADITYCTNKQAAADFLRDQLAEGPAAPLASRLVRRIAESPDRAAPAAIMRGLEWAIVDEADSVLIDEAVTPLILSGVSTDRSQTQAYVTAARLAAALTNIRDFRIDTRWRELTLTERGRSRLAELCENETGVWAAQRRREELVTQALTARHLYHRDQHYVVQDGRVVIVDEFTGRRMPDRAWREGLHSAIEATEGLEVQPPRTTLARISFQRFFRLYRRLSGMTGTAAEARGELWGAYRLRAVRLPTHHPCIRRHDRPRLHAASSQRWTAVVDHVAQLHRAGRPVLIGTRSVEASDHVSDLLRRAGLEHELLNAVRDRHEARIIADAGRAARITVATNMAGRGTDIRPDPDALAAGGLHVIATEPHEAARIDRQLFGRAGRQGDPGSAVLFASLDDDLFRRHAAPISRLLASLLLHLPPPLSPTAALLRRAAQRTAQRRAARMRRHVLATDDWLDDQLGFTRQ